MSHKKRERRFSGQACLCSSGRHGRGWWRNDLTPLNHDVTPMPARSCRATDQHVAPPSGSLPSVRPPGAGSQGHRRSGRCCGPWARRPPSGCGRSARSSGRAHATDPTATSRRRRATVRSAGSRLPPAPSAAHADRRNGMRASRETPAARVDLRAGSGRAQQAAADDRRLNSFLIFVGVRAASFRRGKHPYGQMKCRARRLRAWHLAVDVRRVDARGDRPVLRRGQPRPGMPAMATAPHRAPGLAAGPHRGLGGAYAATIAFLVVNVACLPKPIAFIVPTIIGALLITWASIRHATRINIPMSVG